MRIGILVVALLPYAYFALKDGAMHIGRRKVRTVPLPEHFLHLVLIAPIAWLIGGLLASSATTAAIGGAAFLPLAVADEMIFHRKDVPAVEIDAHAKSHLALLLFVLVGALVWLVDAGVLVLPWR